MFDFKQFGKVLAVTCALVASTSGVVGCAPARPDNAQALVAKVREAGSIDNAHVDGNLGIKFGLGGFNMDMPMVVSGDFSGTSSHINMKADSLGVSAETYSVAEGSKVVQYSKSEGSLMGISTGEPQWTKSDSNFDIQKGVEDFLPDNVVSKAKFSADDDGTYTLTFGKDVVSELAKNVDGGTSGDLAGVPLDMSKVTDASFKVKVSEDFRITSVSGNMKTAYDITEDTNGDMDFNFEFNFSKYGEISEADVKVPDDVVKLAVDANDFGSLVGSGDDAQVTSGTVSTLGDGSAAGSNAASVDDITSRDGAK